MRKDTRKETVNIRVRKRKGYRKKTMDNQSVLESGMDEYPFVVSRNGRVI